MATTIAERRASGKPISDGKLLMFLRRAGHDTRPVLRGAMRDPNALDVLLVRAKWGDPDVKDRLAQSFEEKITRFTSIISGQEVETGKVSGGFFYTEMMDVMMGISTRGSQKASDPNRPHSPSDGSDTSVVASLLPIADALACISDRRDASARYDRIFEFLTGMPTYVMFLQLATSRQGETQTGKEPSARELLGLLAESVRNTTQIAMPPPEDANEVSTLIKVPVRLAGRLGKCPQCGSRIKVPHA